MTPSFAIISGVWGRPTLTHMLESIASQPLAEDDRVIVCIDSFEQGDQPDIKQAVHASGDQFAYCSFDAGYHFMGVAQYNHALSLARGSGCTHLLSLGDDDVFVPGALSCLRAALTTDPDRPLLCRYVTPWRGVLWDKPRLRRKFISGQCLVARIEHVPYVDTKRNASVDFDQILATIAASGQAPRWLDYIAVVARPWLNPAVPVGVMRHVWRCWTCGSYGFAEQERTECCGTSVDLHPAPCEITP